MTHTTLQKPPVVFTPWDRFDPEEYAMRNFGRRILKEDRLIIQTVIEALHRHGAKPRAWRHVADIGAGPNLYPSLLLSPYVRPVQAGGRLDLIEYSEPNRRYMEEVLGGSHPHIAPDGFWRRFEQVMSKECYLWRNALQDVRNKAKVLPGSIFKLPHETYDAVSSYFVAESITTDWQTCEKAIHCLVDSLKPQGFINVAHMLGSRGYPAGKGTAFPAVSVTVEDLAEMYKGKADVKIIQIAAQPNARPGYHGMAVVTGTKL